MTKMESQEELTIKKKRTKRPRPASPLSLTMATSSCSTADGSSGVSHDINSVGFNFVPSSGGLVRGARDEEEDMANCLILLAQGRKQNPCHESGRPANKTTNDVYQCKTCNRCFPSFQALGGHRASHKKPKPAPEEQKKPMVTTSEQERVQLNEETTTLSLQIPGRALCSPSNVNKLRVHECSICGAEFNSGQALGGHMRRHRPIPMIPTNQEEPQEAKKQRPLLLLDLNLPAPEDDHTESKFPFAGKEQVIVFSASPLVDCHY